MKVLFAASEAAPFIKSGGLGDVAGSLPAEMAALGAEMTVILPLYSAIPAKYREKMQFLRHFDVSLAWRSQYCGVYALQDNGIQYYFLDNEFYFKRPSTYGNFDDGERFAFFSRAVLETAAQLELAPDIIHCNDWHTALIPVYLDLDYRKRPGLEHAKTVFTIHNIQYQGMFGGELLGDLFGIPEASRSVVDYHGCINLLKGAIVKADRVTTVSPTYAREILTPEYSHGLDAILRENSAKLSGILNGIDTVSYDPQTDQSIFHTYDGLDFSPKQQNKVNLQRMLCIAEDAEVPMIAVISRLVDHKGMDLIRYAAEELLSRNVQLVVLGTGDVQYEQFFIALQRKYPCKVSARITFSEDMARKIYSGADMLLMPSQSEACGLSQMIAMRYGTVPIVRETGGLADTVLSADEGSTSGNGFSFAPFLKGDILYTIGRALEFYADKPRWQRLVSRAMACDYGWSVSARRYMNLYKGIVDA